MTFRETRAGGRLLRPARSAREALAVGVARAVVTTIAIGTSYVVGSVAADLAATGSDPAVRNVDPAVAMMAEKRCSTAGFRDGSIPASALIRTPDGEVRHVSFDRGWQVHHGGGPAALVAVCRAPVR